FRLHPYLTAVFFDYLPADGETDTCAGHVAAMQALEHTENSFMVPGIDPDSVVPHGNSPMQSGTRGRDPDFRRVCASVLDCVSDEVLKDLNEKDAVACQCGQFPDVDDGAARLDGLLQIIQRPFH